MGKYGTNSRIADSEYMKCGLMICKQCNTKITKGEYLIVEHYDSKRGNEDDYNEVFCFDCSKDRKAWNKHYAEVEAEKFKAEKQLIKDRQKAKELINKSVDIHFDTDEYGNQCIIYKLATT